MSSWIELACSHPDCLNTESLYVEQDTNLFYERGPTGWDMRVVFIPCKEHTPT